MECIDALNLESREVNALLKEKLSSTNKVKIENPHSLHNVAIGSSDDAEIVVEGSTGFYTGGFLDGSKIIVEGNAGWYAGDNMMSGEIIIKENAGCNLGVYQGGGTMLVYGNVGSRLGYGMKGGTTIVCGSAGMWAGQMTLGGKLIILGQVAKGVGESMYKGVIYTRDKKVEDKLGGNVFVDTLAEKEIAELEKLFVKYELEADPLELKAIRPVTSGRHNYKLFKPDLKPELARKYTNETGMGEYHE